MLKQQWRELKSGTDIRGVAVANVEGQTLNLTNEAVRAIINGYLVWLAERNPGKTMRVAVGHDSRISADRISNVVLETLEQAGVTPLFSGLSSTPAMFMTTLELDCDGAIQITASHHPYYRNGLKFFTPSGGLEGSDITEILAFAQDDTQILFGEPQKMQTVFFMERYAELLREMICKETGQTEEQKPLNGYHIVVDAGNGAGGFYVEKVLKPLGADISGSQFLEPDGMFPNHIPNPEDSTAMAAICDATIKHQADLGVIFDTDVDRAGCVDSNGKEINRNSLVALASVIALQENAGGTIVTDSITSSGLKQFIESHLGGVHHRFRRGYKNVINEAIRLNEEEVNAPLAIETSGHAAFRDNHFLDDGAYRVTRIIIQMVLLGRKGKRLQDLIAPLAEPAEEKELRLGILEDEFQGYGNAVIQGLEAYAKTLQGAEIAPDNWEGIRVSFHKEHGDGWFLLRLSVHDPIMPLNIESDTKGGVQKIATVLYPYLEQCDQLDLTSYRRYLEGK